MDKQYAYEHILYELCRMDIGRHKDMAIASGKINMIMAVMQAKSVVGKDWTAVIEDESGTKVVHMKWKGVSAGDADQDIKVEFGELLRERAQDVKDIALVMSC